MICSLYGLQCMLQTPIECFLLVKIGDVSALISQPFILQSSPPVNIQAVFVHLLLRQNTDLETWEKILILSIIKIKEYVWALFHHSSQLFLCYYSNRLDYTIEYYHRGVSAYHHVYNHPEMLTLLQG